MSLNFSVKNIGLIFCSLFLVLAFNSIAIAEDVESATTQEIYMRGTSWDLHFELGGGYVFDRDSRDNFLARARAGVLFVHEPIFFSVGPTVEFGGLSSSSGAVGLQCDAVHLWSGMTLQLGSAFVLEEHSIVSHVAAGYSLFLVEWQRRITYSETAANNALFFKIRIPIGVIAFGLSHL